MYWRKLDKRSDRIDQRAMPIGSPHIKAWRRNRRWRLYVVSGLQCAEMHSLLDEEGEEKTGEEDPI